MAITSEGRGGGASPWRAELGALLTLGVPMALTQLVQFSIQTVDVLMIGRLGAAPLGAAALGLVIYWAVFIFGMGPAIAISPLVAQALGANQHDYDDVRRSVRMGLWLTVLMFPAAFAFFYYVGGVARALGQPPELVELAIPYVLVLAPGLPFMLGVLILRNFLAAIEKTRMPLVFIVFTTVFNAGLNYLLIFGNWGFPRLELVGAGIASAVSHVAGFMLLVIYINKDEVACRFQLFREALVPDWPRFKEVIRLGVPISVTLGFEMMLFNAMVLVVGRIGVDEVAAYQVALNVAALGFMGTLGLSMAGGVRVGLAAGARDAERVRR
ncbi:MAG: MATE family efflux transporter, partial [Gammaproteobacteria bacterium]|nr:MATE family efflux transporter [Gammaproteobacteria bacterium]